MEESNEKTSSQEGNINEATANSGFEQRHENIKIPISELLYGIVFNPSRTMGFFRYYQPWGLALGFMLLVNIISVLLPALSMDWSRVMTSLPGDWTFALKPIRAGLGLFLGVFIFPFYVFFMTLGTSLLHLLAEMAGGKGNVLGLFSATAFIQVISVFAALVKFFTSMLGFGGLLISIPFGLLFLVWQIGLLIIALREIYNFSTVKATFIFFLPTIIAIATFIVLFIFALVFVGPLLASFENLNL